MMRRCHKQLAYEIFLESLHSLNTFSATVLALKGIHAHSLDISHVCDRDYNVLSRDKIFHRDIELIISDMCSSLVAVFFGNSKNLFSDNSKEKFSVRKDRLIFFNFFHQLGIFRLDLLSFKTSKSSQAHIDDCLSLYIGQFKSFD